VSDFEAPALQAAVEIARGMRLATVQQAEQADAVLLLGDDPALVAPRLALALRQAARRVPAEVLAARDIPEWDANAARQAGGEARHPFIVAAARGRWMDRLNPMFVPDDPLAFATALADGLSGPAAQALLGAQRPLVVAGGDAALLYAAANLVLALRRAGVAAQLSLLLPEANSMGLALLDCRPRSQAIAAAAGRDVLVLERDIPAPTLFAEARSVTLLDHLQTPTVARADIAFAVGSFADGDGAFVNLEGRVQHFYKAVFGENDPPPAWALLRDAGALAGCLESGQWSTHAALWADMAAEIPALDGCAPAAPGTARPATLPHRHSGRTAVDANRDVREPLPPQHADSPLGTTMEGPPIHAQTGLAPVLWSPGWNSVQAVLKRPAAAPDGFIFANMPETTTPFPRIPPGPADDRILGTEEMSAYAPAIIARGA
jgi:NADH-quinone oxidoreductase subunit G